MECQVGNVLMVSIGHFNAFTVAKVLHRDLSEKNLMFQVKDGSTKGVVNDWDMASILNDDGEVPTSTAKHRTGTLPFMARDLLRPNPPPHLYRHDLESFFYILVWSTIHYDLKNKVRLPVCKELAPWDGVSFQTAWSAKSAFIATPEAAEDVFANIREGFKDLSEWLVPLRKLFRTAVLSVPEIFDTASKAQYNYDTYGGLLTFGTFMHALGRTPRSASNSRVETS